MKPSLKWDVDGVDWPHRHASRFVDAAGFRWHVQQMGAGPVLLLIHGTGASGHSWRDLLPMLAQDFRCVAIDLPGHGFTDTPSSTRLSLPEMARMVAALLAELALAPALIVAHSAGAAIAAQLWLEEGIDAKGIVAINGAFLPLPGLAGYVFPMAARMLASTSLASRLFARRTADRAAVRRLIAMTGSTIDARGEDLYVRLLRNPVHVAAALGMMARWDVAPLVRRLPRLGSRLHLIVGARDLAVPPSQSRGVRRAVNGAAFTLIEHAGHLAHEEKPGQLAALVLEGWRRGAGEAAVVPAACEVA